jgi:hypothetical protein
MTKPFLPPPTTYEQGLNDLQQAIIYADLSHKKEEMVLNDMKLFSKNQLDNALSRVRERWFIFVLLAFAAGLFIAYILCHSK